MGIFDSFKKRKSGQKPSQPVMPPAPDKSQPLDHTVWKIGDRIDNRYEVYQVLGGPGKSGMGIVYICYDHQFKVAVAIKTFQDKFLQDRASIERFKWEAEIWVRLERHYNIVRAKLVEEINGRPYIFLEYIIGDEQYGADLSGWIHNGGLTLPLTLNFAIQFCRGMIHTERKFREAFPETKSPFIHRDIKPSNILITRDKVVKITDFGLVKALAESDEEFSTTTADGSHPRMGLSKSGNVCGTPAYMSPEQFRGEKYIDTHSDIYSFGCVLYEMINHQPPFTATSFESFQQKHLYSVPETPDTEEKLQKVILKCLEKEPLGRYADFTELEKVLAEIYYSLTGEMVKTPEPDIFEAWELVNKGLSLANLGFYTEAVDCYKKALSLNPHDFIAHNNLGFAFKNQGKLEEAIREYQESLRINFNSEYAHNNMGIAYRDQRKLEEAADEFRQALKINPNYVTARTNLGVVYKHQGKLNEAVDEYRQALKTNSNYNDAHYNLGNAYYDLGNLVEAINEYRQALRVNPHDTDARFRLAFTLEKDGKLIEALDQWKIYLEVAKDLPSQQEWIPRAQKFVTDLENKLH